MKKSLVNLKSASLGVVLLAGVGTAVMQGCARTESGANQPVSSVMSGDAASKVYVAPGKHDEFYHFKSGGFSGQIGVYGIPSGRLLKVIPVFSQNPENGWGYSEESKPMFQTSHGFAPWDDTHHPELSMTNGESDGRWLFINSNNTPRVARIDLTTFKTVEIMEIPNSGGNHASPFATMNTEYIVAATRFSVPMGENQDVPISSFKENFKGNVSFIKVDPKSGELDLSFQIETPGVSFDLARSGRGASEGWFFFSCYNTEQAYTLMEVNSSQRDKDFIMAVNWKKAEEYVKAGKGQRRKAEYRHNLLDEHTHMATSRVKNDVLVLDPKELPGMVYFIPCPKSPHGADVSPSGEDIIASGKLAAIIPVYSFAKIKAAVDAQKFEGNFEGIPVIKYEDALRGEVKKPGLGPLHTEFDGRGNAYTSMFVSSEVVKWDIKTLEVLDRIPTYYSIGHLSVMGGNTMKPDGKYLVAMNKITKDRYLPTGPELTQSAQLIDITGDKMKLLLDYPTIGEPHYAVGIRAEKLTKNQKKIYKLEENKHPYKVANEKEARIERKGNQVHVYMASIRSHFTPDNIEGIKIGDEVYFHVTNLEQDWDVPHGFAIKGSDNAELLIMPGETQTYKWKPNKVTVYPMYCTDFCSALHQEMQGYIRVSPANSNVPLTWHTGEIADEAVARK